MCYEVWGVDFYATLLAHARLLYYPQTFMLAAQASLHEPAASSNNIKTSRVSITYRPSVLFDLLTD